MMISHPIGRGQQVDFAGIPAEPQSGAGAPAKKGGVRTQGLTVTTASSALGMVDGTDGIPSAALNAALRRDDDVGLFVNAVLEGIR